MFIIIYFIRGPPLLLSSFPSGVMGSGLVPENARSLVVGDPNLNCSWFINVGVLTYLSSDFLSLTPALFPSALFSIRSRGNERKERDWIQSHDPVSKQSSLPD